MNLAARRSALLQNKVVMRLGVMLVITSMIVSWVAVPKAKAVAVVDDVALGAAATAAYLTSTGIPLTVTAGGASAASAGIVAVAGEYAAATGAAASGEALLTTIAAGTALTTAGAVVLTAAAAAAVGALAYWVYETYCVDSSNPEIYSNTFISDSSGFSLSTFIKVGADGFEPTGTCIPYGSRIDFDDGSYISLSDNGVNSKCTLFFYHSADSKSYSTSVYRTNEDPVLSTGVWLMCDGGTVYRGTYNTKNRYVCTSAGVLASFFDGILNVESLSLIDIDFQPIPEIAPAKQLELDISAPPELELADVPEFAFEKVASGGWSQPSNVPHSVTSADPDPVPDPDPDPDPADPGSGDPTVPPDTPDVDDLGLPDLGAALTTRFPFSIPWDIYRGLKLLSAPAVVPKFKVDFYRAIDTDLIDFGKGDTE